ncbi:MAG: restriction endonuclease subunit S [Candidatus Hydrogenedentes bacterium]|nr:restriction endonuclease subunit S [Candidatus Hydrogenedentota bacterium]
MSVVAIPMDEKKMLPKDWRWARLGDVIREVQAGFACGERDPEGIAQLRMNNLDTRGNFVWDEVLRVPEPGNKIEPYLLLPGDVLFNNTNSTELVGKSAMFAGYSERIVYSNHFTRLRANSALLLPEILSNWLILQWHEGTFAAICNKWIGQSAVKADKLLNLEMPLPPLPEQRRIAEVLREQMAAVDKARAAAQARLEAVRALPAAFLRQVFGDEPAFAASPVTPDRPVQAGWTWHRLTDIARLATGHTPSRYHPEYWKGDIPWLQLADIRELDGQEAQDTSEHTNILGLENSAAVLLPKGTVCLSRTASVGFFAIMGRPMATSQDFVNWVCSDNLDPWFLMYLLIANRKRIRDLGSGAVHHTIYFPTVQSFSVCAPPIKEQRRIAGFLRDALAGVEKARVAADEELRAINALPAALLHRAFRGKA